MRDPRLPLFHWYNDSVLGKELVFSLYTRPCRYARCAFCGLPGLSEGGEALTAQDIEAQIDHVMASYDQARLDQVAKVSIYTAASVLDQACLPTRSLMHLLLRVCDLPKLQVVSLETRPEYVEEWELDAISAVLGEVGVEVAIGYETHDPTLRNKVLGKGLLEVEIQHLMRRLGKRRMALKAYVLLKPHWSLDEEQGVQEAVDGLDHLRRLGEEHEVPVSVHLNPTYISQGCALTDELVAHGFQPPELSSVLRVVEQSVARGLPIYVGLDDEGLALEGGTFRSTGLERERTVAALLAFNRHQDLQRLNQEIAA